MLQLKTSTEQLEGGQAELPKRRKRTHERKQRPEKSRIKLENYNKRKADRLNQETKVLDDDDEVFESAEMPSEPTQMLRQATLPGQTRMGQADATQEPIAMRASDVLTTTTSSPEPIRTPLSGPNAFTTEKQSGSDAEPSTSTALVPVQSGAQGWGAWLTSLVPRQIGNKVTRQFSGIQLTKVGIMNPIARESAPEQLMAANVPASTYTYQQMLTNGMSNIGSALGTGARSIFVNPFRSVSQPMTAPQQQTKLPFDIEALKKFVSLSADPTQAAGAATMTPKLVQGLDVFLKKAGFSFNLETLNEIVQSKSLPDAGVKILLASYGITPKTLREIREASLLEAVARVALTTYGLNPQRVQLIQSLGMQGWALAKNMG